MPSPWYLVVAIAVAGLITLALRAVPFLLLKPMRESQLVKDLGTWMPAGVLLILAVVTFSSSAEGGRLVASLVALAVTVVVHLAFGRRSLLSIGAGTLVFVALINWF